MATASSAARNSGVSRTVVTMGALDIGVVNNFARGALGHRSPTTKSLVRMSISRRPKGLLMPWGDPVQKRSMRSHCSAGRRPW
jgi:hypothetical protein